MPLAHRGNLLDVTAWVDAPDGGKVGSFAVRSPSALEIRLGLQASLPAGAVVRFFQPGMAAHKPYPVATPNDFAKLGADSPEPGTRVDRSGRGHPHPSLRLQASPALKSTVGPSDSTTDLLWSPFSTGDELGVEVHLPPGADPAAASLHVRLLSHVVDDWLEAGALNDGRRPAGNPSAATKRPGADSKPLLSLQQEPRPWLPKASAKNTCGQVDVACAEAPACQQASTVRIRFVWPDGRTLLCSATAIQSSRDDAVDATNPYLMTAYHCVYGQQSAATVQTAWFLEDAPCDGDTRTDHQTTTGGAVLRAVDYTNDSTLIELNDAAPDGACLAGWDLEAARAIQEDDPVFGIHHAGGAPKQWAAGEINRIYRNWIVAHWSEGNTGPGSSGSGLWAHDENGSPMLVGTASLGSGSCNASYGPFEHFTSNVAAELLLGAPVEDDHGGSSDSATTLSLGSTVEGRFERIGDADVFEFKVSVPGEFEAEFTAGEPMLQVFGTRLQLALSYSGQIQLDLEPGTYYLRVAGYSIHDYSFDATFKRNYVGRTAKPRGKTRTEVAEAGGVATYTVALDEAPDRVVTVAIASDDTTMATASPAIVTFDATNYDTPQTITVTGVDDDIVNPSDRETKVRHNAASADYNVRIRRMTVHVLDDDGPAVTVTETGGYTEVAEAAGTDTYTVVLDNAPSAAVTVSVTSDDTSVATVSPTSLTFTTTDYERAQTVTVTGVDDGVFDVADRGTTIRHTVSGGGYDGVDIASVNVTVLDDELASAPSATVTETGGYTEVVEDGGTDTYMVVLETAPRGTVTVSVSSADPTIARVDPTTLTFTTANYDTPQLVTVIGVDDGDGVATRQAAITHAATGGAYDGVAIDRVMVTVRDSQDVREPEEPVGRATLDEIAGLVPKAADPTLQGFLRIINHDAQAGELAIDAVDDWAQRYERLTLQVQPHGTAKFNSDDLEDGNEAKGLSGGVGPGYGDWRLAFTSALDVERLSYVRTSDGFVTAMHDAVVVGDEPALLPTFNPGSNASQASWLRLINPNATTATVTIGGIDDTGLSPAEGATAIVSGGRSLNFTARELETGAASLLSGMIGDGVGKWRLALTSNVPVLAMSLMSTPSGHVTNLSTVPEAGAHLVPLFPSASDSLGRQGFARIVNRSPEDGVVTIHPYDESSHNYEPVMLAIGAGATVHFNSDDLEGGNAAKGLTGATGSGLGDWWLQLSSELDMLVLSYIRTKSDGFLSSMHDLVPVADGVHTLATLNPGGNVNQVGMLRILNIGTQAANVTMVATDDLGESSATPVALTLPARRGANFTSQELESGYDADLSASLPFTGQFGDGTGRWRVAVTADRPIHVMALIHARTGHLTNLSTRTRQTAD